MFQSARPTTLTAIAVRCPQAWVIEIPSLRLRIGVSQLDRADLAVSRIVRGRGQGEPGIDLVSYVHLDDLTGHRRWSVEAASRRCVDGRHPPESAA